MPYTSKRVRDDALAILRAEPDRAADAGVKVHVFGQRGQNDPLSQFGLDEDRRIIATCAGLWADIDRDVRPR